MYKSIFLVVFLFLFAFSSEFEKERYFWDEIKDSNDIELLKLYKQKYPDGIFISIANKKIEYLDSKKSYEIEVLQEVPLWIKGDCTIYRYFGFGRANKHFKGEDYQKSLAIKRADRELFGKLENSDLDPKIIEKLKTQIETKLYKNDKDRIFILRYVEN